MQEGYNKVLLWGEEGNVWEACDLIQKLLARSQANPTPASTLNRTCSTVNPTP